MSISIYERRQAAQARMQHRAAIEHQLASGAGALLPAETELDAASALDLIDPSGALRAAVRAIAPLVETSPGFELAVSAGPDFTWLARLVNRDGQAEVELTRDVPAEEARPAAPPAQVDPVVAGHATAAEHATVPTAPDTPGLTTVSEGAASPPDKAAPSHQDNVAAEIATLLWGGQAR